MESGSGADSAAASELLTAIGMALSEIANQNDSPSQEECESDVLTFFHSYFMPQISVADYVHRLGVYCQCSPECFILAVIFLDRFLAAAPYFRLSSLTAHRLIITAVLLAVKSIDDDHFRNAYYAYVGGVPVAELNRMELVFLKAIDFNLYVAPETFATFRERLRWYLVDHAINDSQTPYPKWASAATIPADDAAAIPSPSADSAPLHSTPRSDRGSADGRDGAGDGVCGAFPLLGPVDCAGPAEQRCGFEETDAACSVSTFGSTADLAALSLRNPRPTPVHDGSYSIAYHTPAAACPDGASAGSDGWPDAAFWSEHADAPAVASEPPQAPACAHRAVPAGALSLPRRLAPCADDAADELFARGGASAPVRRALAATG